MAKSDDGIEVIEPEKEERRERRKLSIHKDAENFWARPLDRVRGELIGDLGWDFVVVPASKWADTPAFVEAGNVAAKMFRRAGFPKPTFSEELVLLQEYHSQGRLAIVFAQWGQRNFRRNKSWCLAPVVIRFPPPLLAHLVLTGRWPASPVIRSTTLH
ncbi:MAG: hypothetical protein KDI55_00235 [Anaerolineae bacterium]|nr:hypothetical protein [Anaerolineae bacterium]